MPKITGAKRKTENAALRGLSRREEAELEAVRRAIEDIGRSETGGEVLRVVELYHWKNIRNFETVGYLAHMSSNTAKRRNSKFVYTVAKNMGYI